MPLHYIVNVKYIFTISNEMLAIYMRVFHWHSHFTLDHMKLSVVTPFKSKSVSQKKKKKYKNLNFNSLKLPTFWLWFWYLFVKQNVKNAKIFFFFFTEKFLLKFLFYFISFLNYIFHFDSVAPLSCVKFYFWKNST